jgi:hypothetical protein
VISPGVVAIKGHNSDGHSMISPGAVVTKGHNNDLPISSTLLTRIHAHQLLNIRQSEGFEDQKQLVLHMVLLTPGTMCAGIRSIPCKMFC